MSLTSVKWASFGRPIVHIRHGDMYIPLSKLELKDLRDQLFGFIEYYREDFADGSIGIPAQSELDGELIPIG